MNTKKIYRDERKQRNDFLFPRSSFFSLVTSVFCLSLFFSSACQTQTQKSKENTLGAQTETVSNLPKVTQIDATGLKNLLKPNGRPLLINFWATWCAPCREEFPDLVKIGTDYKGKIDLIAVSLDELSEINGEVPKFLAQMKSESPAYLLKTPDENAAIELVSKDWQGALPFTILFNAQGETVYTKQGKFKTDVLAAEIEKILTVQSQIANLQITELPLNRGLYWDLN
jgi:thiol-disulfide isomerase/thioredoxin